MGDQVEHRRARVHWRIVSREPLRVPGERLWRVPSLAAPDPGLPPAPEQLGRYPAVELFVERARAVKADFALTTQNARAVAEACARLDGIPLAIELAAARLRALGVEQIAARLGDSFRLLGGGLMLEVLEHVFPGNAASRTGAREPAHVHVFLPH